MNQKIVLIIIFGLSFVKAHRELNKSNVFTFTFGTVTMVSITLTLYVKSPKNILLMTRGNNNTNSCTLASADFFPGKGIIFQGTGGGAKIYYLYKN
jgi:hypothetical protein